MQLPKVTSTNFYECESENYSCEFNDFDAGKSYKMNCFFVQVSNEIYPNEVIVHNDHLNNKPEKPIEGINMWSCDNWLSVGFWHVKYKS